MKTVLMTAEVIISILLTALILMQNKDGGLSAIMGGGSRGFQSTRRGAEKVIYHMTVILGVLFCGVALAFIFI